MEIRIESDSEKGKFYTVDTIKLTCDCPHFTYRGGMCKHIEKALAKVEELADTYQQREWEKEFGGD
jgi:hypothetical protein